MTYICDLPAAVAAPEEHGLNLVTLCSGKGTLSRSPDRSGLNKVCDCLSKNGRNYVTGRFAIAALARPFLDEFRSLLTRPQPLAIA